MIYVNMLMFIIEQVRTIDNILNEYDNFTINNKLQIVRF